jgi:transcriptional regulator with XRE-family HTH domain
MASRTHLTGRQLRLATEIRRMREHAGVSIQQAAALLGVDRTMVSNLEGCRMSITEERVHQLAAHYNCPDAALVDALAAIARSRKSPDQWWNEYRGKLPDGFLDVSELEHYAVRIRTAQTNHAPGLFQTEEYARAVFDLVVPPLRRLDVELRVAHRLARRAVFDRESPTPYTGIIHEAALRIQFGGPKVSRAQLDFLAEAGRQEHVRLLVIPFSAGGFPGAGQAVLYAEGAVPDLDTVQLDTPYGAAFVDSPTPLTNYRALLDLWEGMALPPGKSRDLMRAIARDT